MAKTRKRTYKRKVRSKILRRSTRKSLRRSTKKKNTKKKSYRRSARKPFKRTRRTNKLRGGMNMARQWWSGHGVRDSPTNPLPQAGASEGELSQKQLDERAAMEHALSEAQKARDANAAKAATEDASKAQSTSPVFPSPGTASPTEGPPSSDYINRKAEWAKIKAEYNAAKAQGTSPVFRDPDALPTGGTSPLSLSEEKYIDEEGNDITIIPDPTDPNKYRKIIKGSDKKTRKPFEIEETYLKGRYLGPKLLGVKLG